MVFVNATTILTNTASMEFQYMALLIHELF